MAGNISRRDFLKRSAMGAAIGAVALSSLNLGKLLAASTQGSFFKTGDDMIVKLSDTKNAALATVGGSIMLDDDNILIRSSQSQFLAVNLICRHKGCTVELQGDKFVCPCHGSEFSLHGDVLKGPASEPLISLPVTADAENVVVHFS